mmetsp:Transcript_13466/g.22175  ORF Transcript_13466/g.22175 Transcript_13466/m.22175 type:complete len:114 (+) Transcript_13466:93-434(+)|eukprot:CAMPEP_0169118546 /NCGR_PEP_ID=MMETSP1015-20121227/31055_1 /TAXON_ID=342587 /ORGANISM="Karlodinium micrum, Strain CCMP2283" /LENGTH=113 /DNA_ID=CAMNT_0009181315 /DNA_START=68 /DNA_END=409 /DNA_ORIENTATION=+
MTAMEEEGENEFVSEEINQIVRKAIDKTIGQQDYIREKVNGWCTQIIDDCLKALAGLQKPFKYVVTCIIVQKNGAPMHTGLALYWDTKTDGVASMQIGTESMDCITTVFASMI